MRHVIALCGWVTVFWVAHEAWPQAMPQYPQPHSGSRHWYPPNCCSQRDCEPLPIDSVTENGDGSYDVHYLSERFGQVDEHIKLGEVRDSKDGGFHGCWRLNPETKPRTICFFRPVNA